MMSDLPPLSKVLTRTAEHLEQGWCQRTFAQDAQGRSVAPVAPDAARWCVEGAVTRALVELCPEALTTYPVKGNGLFLTAAGGKLYCDSVDRIGALLFGPPLQITWLKKVADWNDAACRTDADVVAAVRRAAAEVDDGAA